MFSSLSQTLCRCLVCRAVVDFSRRGLIEHLLRNTTSNSKKERCQRCSRKRPSFSDWAFWRRLASWARFAQTEVPASAVYRAPASKWRRSRLPRIRDGIDVRALSVDGAHGTEAVRRSGAQRSARRCLMHHGRRKKLIGDAISNLAMAVGQVALALPGYVWNRVASQGPWRCPYRNCRQ